MTEITKWNDTGDDMFCKSQLITCNRVKECNGVCPFEDALKHADKEMDELSVIDHDRDWIIGCIKHDGFIKTDRFDKANQIILDALSSEAKTGEWVEHIGGISHELYYFCDQCYGEVDTNDYNFCPNCGARMLKGGEQDGNV